MPVFGPGVDPGGLAAVGLLVKGIGYAKIEVPADSNKAKTVRVHATDTVGTQNPLPRMVITSYASIEVAH